MAILPPRGLQNNSQSETFTLKHSLDDHVFPCNFIKIGNILYFYLYASYMIGCIMSESTLLHLHGATETFSDVVEPFGPLKNSSMFPFINLSVWSLNVTQKPSACRAFASTY